MEFLIEQAALLKILTHVHSVVERRNTIPILSNILIKAEKDGTLSMTATDLDVQIVESLSVKITEAGETTLSAQTLFEIARKAPEGAEISFSAADGRIQIKTGRTVFAIPTLPSEDFPTVTEDDMEAQFTLPSTTVATMIDKVRCAISTDEMRYFLNGIFLHVTEEDDKPLLHAVATDGHRLAKVSIPRPEGAESMPDVIVPRKSIHELRKLIEDSEDGSTIDIALSSNRIRFAIGKAVLSSKLIDGSFPDYARVIPTENDKMLAIERDSFALGVDRVTAIAQEKTRSAKFKMDNHNIAMSYSSSENGNAHEELSCVYDAEELEVRFNARYLLDILDQMDGTVEVHFAGAGDPALFRAKEDKEDESVLYVLMPMRV